MLNPAIAQRCDCGYDFDLGRTEKPYGKPLPKPVPVISLRWLPALAALFGARAVTVALFQSGHTAVAWLVTLGIPVVLWIGWMAYRKSRSTRLREHR